MVTNELSRMEQNRTYQGISQPLNIGNLEGE